MKGDPMEPQTPREPRSDLPDEVERALKATCRIGYGLLVGAIIFDVLSVQFASVRRFCGAAVGQPRRRGHTGRPTGSRPRPRPPRSQRRHRLKAGRCTATASFGEKSSICSHTVCSSCCSHSLPGSAIAQLVQVPTGCAGAVLHAGANRRAGCQSHGCAARARWSCPNGSEDRPVQSTARPRDLPGR